MEIKTKEELAKAMLEMVNAHIRKECPWIDKLEEILQVPMEMKIGSKEPYGESPVETQMKITGTASKDQRKFIKNLGGNPPNHLDKMEAGFMIDELKKKSPKVTKSHRDLPLPKPTKETDPFEEEFNDSFEKKEYTEEEKAEFPDY